MFGRFTHHEGNGQTPPPSPAAGELARIEGGGLVQAVVTHFAPLTYFLFLNNEPVDQMDVESLQVYISTPDGAGDSGTVRATLARYVTNVTGQKSMERVELFPCTLEMVAAGRRISITAMRADSFDGLWVTLGLKPDGTGNELSGLKSLNLLLTGDLLSASLTWEDGHTEDLLPQ
jgi:hypothetical protein